MNKIVPLSEQEFVNKYWYASELKKLAKSIGILKTGALRKDDLEEIILKYIKTGILHTPVKNRLNYKKNVEDTLSVNIPPHSGGH